VGPDYTRSSPLGHPPSHLLILQPSLHRSPSGRPGGSCPAASCGSNLVILYCRSTVGILPDMQTVPTCYKSEPHQQQRQLLSIALLLRLFHDMERECTHHSTRKKSVLMAAAGRRISARLPNQVEKRRKNLLPYSAAPLDEYFLASSVIREI
jgi:hypothetical protein